MIFAPGAAWAPPPCPPRPNTEPNASTTPTAEKTVAAEKSSSPDTCRKTSPGTEEGKSEPKSDHSPQWVAEDDHSWNGNWGNEWGNDREENECVPNSWWARQNHWSPNNWVEGEKIPTTTKKRKKRSAKIQNNLLRSMKSKRAKKKPLRNIRKPPRSPLLSRPKKKSPNKLTQLPWSLKSSLMHQNRRRPRPLAFRSPKPRLCTLFEHGACRRSNPWALLPGVRSPDGGAKHGNPMGAADTKGPDGPPGFSKFTDAVAGSVQLFVVWRSRSGHGFPAVFARNRGHRPYPAIALRRVRGGIAFSRFAATGYSI